MTAVDRLAATLSEHEWRPQSAAWYEPYGACGCGHNTAQDGDWKPYDVGCWAAHLAAVIASVDNLAVVSLPKPDDEGRAVWRLDPAAKPGYPDGSYVRTRHWPAGTRIGAHGVADMRVPDAERAAAALLAAVKAAEAVDRG